MRAHLDLLSLCRAWSALPIACPLLEARARTLADRVIAANPLDADTRRAWVQAIHATGAIDELGAVQAAIDHTA